MRALIPAALVVLVACGGEASSSKKPPPPPPREVQLVTVAPTEARVAGEYLGTLLSRASLTVMPQVAGYVRKLHVRPGQRVRVGDPLVEIDAREESAALSSASAQAEAAAAALALAEQSRTRIEALHREGLATAAELDKVRADVAAAGAAVRAAGAQVSQRRVAVGNRVVRAAVPGAIGEVVVRLGDYVTATTRLTTIAGGDGLELTLGIPAPRARGLVDDAPIEVLGDDGQVLHTTRAFYVAAEADPRTQLVAVKAAVPADLGLRPAELVRARLIYSAGLALQVPAMAVVRQSGAAFVFVAVEKAGALIAERRLIQLGALGPRGFVVAAGLNPGERIAVSSVQSLRDGAAIKPAAPKPDGAAPVKPDGAAPAKPDGAAPAKPDGAAPAPGAGR
ncbi:MAG: efflux RND transporter periplasmic adaptor subunit [Kofleriaceae bacterium]|nr:efflux RND transporter periplasmic adaptor subunit [Kofleriaceae bacterium]MBP9166857.1 efflux RND transporter periplasmic adaptor subunit [Kofleriaceae bacterium]MBP9859988.1 efflux RND transporter periplasmic adaptor subunit [Kofleriaceae bacterium]